MKRFTLLAFSALIALAAPAALAALPGKTLGKTYKPDHNPGNHCDDPVSRACPYDDMSKDELLDYLKRHNPYLYYKAKYLLRRGYDWNWIKEIIVKKLCAPHDGGGGHSGDDDGGDDDGGDDDGGDDDGGGHGYHDDD